MVNITKHIGKGSPLGQASIDLLDAALDLILPRGLNSNISRRFGLLQKRASQLQLLVLRQGQCLLRDLGETSIHTAKTIVRIEIVEALLAVER
jgi:hypothetical protein